MVWLSNFSFLSEGSWLLRLFWFQTYSSLPWLGTASGSEEERSIRNLRNRILVEKSSKTNTSSSSSLELEDQPAEGRLTSSSCGGLGDRRDPDTSDDSPRACGALLGFEIPLFSPAVLSSVMENF